MGKKLFNMSVPGRLWALIRNLYSDKFLQIHIPGSSTLSNPMRVRSGVGQGCILAPHLFNLYRNVFHPGPIVFSPTKWSACTLFSINQQSSFISLYFLRFSENIKQVLLFLLQRIFTNKL